MWLISATAQDLTDTVVKSPYRKESVLCRAGVDLAAGLRCGPKECEDVLGVSTLENARQNGNLAEI
jgi:hypothetical protein